MGGAERFRTVVGHEIGSHVDGSAVTGEIQESLEFWIVRKVKSAAFLVETTGPDGVLLEFNEGLEGACTVQESYLAGKDGVGYFETLGR